MKVYIDTNACIECGICSAERPEIFSVESGPCKVIIDTVPDEFRESILTIADQCPAAAIFIENEPGSPLEPAKKAYRYEL